jgi:hypothetical protein
MTPSGPLRLDHLRFETSYGTAWALPGPGGETIGEGIARLEGTVRKLATSATLDCGAVVDAVASEAHDDDSCLVLAWHDG